MPSTAPRPRSSCANGHPDEHLRACGGCNITSLLLMRTDAVDLCRTLRCCGGTAPAVRPDSPATDPRHLSAHGVEFASLAGARMLTEK